MGCNNSPDFVKYVLDNVMFNKGLNDSTGHYFLWPDIGFIRLRFSFSLL